MFHIGLVGLEMGRTEVGLQGGNMCPPGGLPAPSFGVKVAGSITMGPRLARGPLTDSHRGTQTIRVSELEHLPQPSFSLVGILVRVSPSVLHLLDLFSVDGAKVLRNEVRPSLPSSRLATLVPVLVDGELAIEGTVVVVLVMGNPPSAYFEESRIPAQFTHVAVEKGLG
jgi:hypothetical protein